MRFADWLEEERGRLAFVADHFGVSQSAVGQWKNDGVPVDRMRAIRALSRDRVTLDEMLEEREARRAAKAD